MSNKLIIITKMHLIIIKEPLLYIKRHRERLWMLQILSLASAIYISIKGIGNHHSKVIAKRQAYITRAKIREMAMLIWNLDRYIINAKCIDKPHRLFNLRFRFMKVLKYQRFQGKICLILRNAIKNFRWVKNY